MKLADRFVELADRRVRKTYLKSISELHDSSPVLGLQVCVLGLSTCKLCMFVGSFYHKKRLSNSAGRGGVFYLCPLFLCNVFFAVSASGSCLPWLLLGIWVQSFCYNSTATSRSLCTYLAGAVFCVKWWGSIWQLAKRKRLYSLSGRANIWSWFCAVRYFFVPNELLIGESSGAIWHSLRYIPLQCNPGLLKTAPDIALFYFYCSFRHVHGATMPWLIIPMRPNKHRISGSANLRRQLAVAVFSFLNLSVVWHRLEDMARLVKTGKTWWFVSWMAHTVAAVSKFSRQQGTCVLCGWHSLYRWLAERGHTQNSVHVKWSNSLKKVMSGPWFSNDETWTLKYTYCILAQQTVHGSIQGRFPWARDVGIFTEGVVQFVSCQVIWVMHSNHISPSARTFFV